MSTAGNILADPAVELERMVREDARRQLEKLGDTLYIRRVSNSLRQRADECGAPRETCGGCRIILTVAASLEKPEGAA